MTKWAQKEWNHQVISHLSDGSPTFRAQIPRLCGNCHKEGGQADDPMLSREHAALTDYSTSVHGRGLTEKGLLPSAICTDCHNTHMIFSSDDERSSVYHENIPATCSTCHRGIFKDFITSIHFSLDHEQEKNLPS